MGLRTIPSNLAYALNVLGTCGQVRNTPVQTREVQLTVLRVPETKVEEIRSVEASMRLDAVASAGFRMSRSKMLDLIKNGDVKYDFLPVQ